MLRLKRAMDAFVRRLQAGETPGYPRFRGKGRYDSLTYPQWENGVKLSASGKRLLLSKLGEVKLITHRPLEGIPKTATIRRTPTGKWFVSISCDWEPTPLPPTGKAVGIDVGLKTFATLIRREEIANPRFFRAEEQALARAQTKASGGPGCPQSQTRRGLQAGPAGAARPGCAAHLAGGEPGCRGTRRRGVSGSDGAG